MKTKMAVGDETLEYQVQGRTVKVVTRPADGDQLARLFDFGASPKWTDSSPMSDEDVASVVRGLIDQATKNGEQAGILGVPPTAALSFPNDPRIAVSPIEPVSFSLPGSPTGLILQMDDRGDGHLWALGDERIPLGSDGMWWIVTTLIDALTAPAAASTWSRILTLGSTLGGPATQAKLDISDSGIGIVWRKLDNGVVGEVVAVQELSSERVDGWLRLLRPVRDELARNRAHRHRLSPARTAERWARAMERWSN